MFVYLLEQHTSQLTSLRYETQAWKTIVLTEKAFAQTLPTFAKEKQLQVQSKSPAVLEDWEEDSKEKHSMTIKVSVWSWTLRQGAKMISYRQLEKPRTSSTGRTMMDIHTLMLHNHATSVKVCSGTKIIFLHPAYLKLNLFVQLQTRLYFCTLIILIVLC